MEKNEAEQLKQDILRSGIPLEVEISSILREDNWTVLNQFPYIDETEKKIRAIDIIAFKFTQEHMITLVIECKKGTDHPWTFYTTHKFSDFWAGIVTLANSFRKLVSKELSIGQFPKSHIFDEDVKTGTISYIPFGKRDDFFEALNQVLRPLFSFDDFIKKAAVKKKPITYPLIVFDGNIYEFEIKDKEELTVVPIDYLQFVAGGTLDRVQPCLVDVMRKTYFSKFLKRIDQELNDMSQST